MKTSHLCGFPENDEFGFQSGHALSFQQEVAEVFVAAARRRRDSMLPLTASTTPNGTFAAVVQDSLLMPE